LIKFIGNDSSGRPILGVGLSRENCERLLAGKSIEIDLATTRIESTIVGGIDLNIASLVILGGETDRSITANLHEILGADENTPKLLHEEEN
jgi:hypothetical protein